MTINRKWWTPWVTALLLWMVGILLPQPAQAEPSAAVLDGGMYHSVAVKEDGTAWSWGYNAYGQLGNGTTTSKKLITQVSGLTDVVSIAAGSHFTVALKNDGTVWTWGRNYYGQLGDGTTTTRKLPVQVMGLSDIIAIKAGNNYTLALKSDGTVWAWGQNSSGQLGDGTTTGRKTPVQVIGLTNVTSITAGANFNIALKDDGSLWAWGQNNYGQLGDATSTTRKSPVQVSGIRNVSSIAAGQYFSLALVNDGTVWSWGQNGSGQLGDGTTTTRKTPVQVKNLSNVGAITADGNFALALLTDGTVMAWGQNNYGQLGDGSTTTRKTPIQMPGLSDVTKIAAGKFHYIALKNDDTVWAGGYNRYGQLGDTTTTTRKTPVQVVGLRIVNENTITDPDIGDIDDPLEPDDPEDPSDPDDPENLDLINAQNAVAYAEALADAGLETYELIVADQKAHDDALILVNLLSDGSDKTGLIARLAVVRQKIELAQAVLDATRKVAETEALANGDLSTQLLFEAMYGAYSEAMASVGLLPEIPVKDELYLRLYAVQLKINDARAILDVTRAEQTKLQADVSKAWTSVNLLPAGELKTNLSARLKIVQTIIDATNLLNSVINGTYTTFKDIDAGIIKLQKARLLIDSLPDSADKVYLNELYKQAEAKLYDALKVLLSGKQKGKPKRLSISSLELIVRMAIRETGATTTNDRGMVMGYVMSLVNFHATGNQVNQIINRLLPAPEKKNPKTK